MAKFSFDIWNRNFTVFGAISKVAARSSGCLQIREVPPPAIPGTLSVPLAIVSRGSRKSVAVLMDLDELVDDWTYLRDERELVAGKRGPTRLRFAGWIWAPARPGVQSQAALSAIAGGIFAATRAGRSYAGPISAARGMLAAIRRSVSVLEVGDGR